MADLNIAVSSAGITFQVDGAGAAAAAVSAAAAAAATNTFISTSTTSLTIGAGTQIPTVAGGKQFQAGQFVLISSSADATKWMWGTVNSYNSGTGALSVAVTLTGGSGTFASWNVSVSGVQGSGTNAATLNGKADSAFAQLALANTFTLAQVIAAGSVVVSTPVLDLSQTWNAGAVTFTGFKLNVTSTASAAASLLMDLQVGGSSKFSVDKTGAVIAAASIRSATSIGFNGGALLTVSGTAAVSLQNNIGTASVNLYVPANNELRLGGIDVAAPGAQTFSVANVLAGTSNAAGANRIYAGSQGTGLGVGGSHIFQVAPAGSTGTAQNALVTALTIASDKSATFAGAVTAAATSTASSFLATQGASTATPALDASSQTILSVAASSNAVIMTGVGYATLLIAEVTSTGQTALWILANGNAILVSTSAVWVASTSTPGASTMSIHHDGTNYRVYVGSGIAAGFRTVLLKAG